MTAAGVIATTVMVIAIGAIALTMVAITDAPTSTSAPVGTDTIIAIAGVTTATTGGK